ncbi:unnamed protein product [Urochloa decumbens]|uniref:Uncharacterized protein n=1 Tax=Urochloa decumbens TaxID=240449 RepID=A0ABC8VUM5_9POAL
MAAAASYLPTLGTAPKPFFYASHHLRSQTISSATAACCRGGGRIIGCMETARDCGSASHHCAWANIRQERWEGDLAVQGHIPAWLNGTYLRNGPGVWEVGSGEHTFEHVFDGYATLVRVSIRGARGRAAGAHRQIESDAYTSAMTRGRPVMREFSQICPRDPGNLLDRLRGAAGLAAGAVMSDNANTVVLPLGDGRRVLCLADVNKSSVLVDPETLGTIGKLQYTDRLWWWRCPVQCTHPVVTRSGSGDELLTLLPDFARRGYLAVRMPTTGSSEREVLGRVRCRGGPTPGWVHSFAVTERYIVVPEMPLRYSVDRMLKSETGPLYVLDWLPDSGSFMHVICRSTGNTVASVAVPPFVAFHFINAYEERGDDDGGGMANAVIADCCEYYADPAIIQALALHRLRSLDTAKELFPESRVARFRIPLDGSPLGMLETVLDPDAHGRGVELSTINPAYTGREYRYLYACSIRRPYNFFNSLTKMDLVEKDAKSWHEEGTVPSEPFFVARPGGELEDDGVVISTVTSMDGGGYVLLLDAATFKEIARLRFPYGLPVGFHGCWIPDKSY